MYCFHLNRDPKLMEQHTPFSHMLNSSCSGIQTLVAALSLRLLVNKLLGRH